MILSSEIFDFLDILAPPALAMDWDNSGLQPPNGADSFGGPGPL